MDIAYLLKLWNNKKTNFFLNHPKTNSITVAWKQIIYSYLLGSQPNVVPLNSWSQFIFPLDGWYFATPLINVNKIAIFLSRKIINELPPAWPSLISIIVLDALTCRLMEQKIGFCRVFCSFSGYNDRNSSRISLTLAIDLRLLWDLSKVILVGTFIIGRTSKHWVSNTTPAESQVTC